MVLKEISTNDWIADIGKDEVSGIGGIPSEIYHDSARPESGD